MLLVRIKNGDLSALEDIASTYRNLFEGIFWSSGGHSVQHLYSVDDLVQDTCIRVVHGIHTYDPSRNSESSWIHTVAYRVLVDAGRKIKRRRGVPLYIGDHDTPDPTKDASAAAEDREEMQVRLKVLHDLPEVARDMILRLSRGETYTQIAESLNLPEGTVKSRLSRYREIASECLRRRSRTSYTYEPAKSPRQAEKDTQVVSELSRPMSESAQARRSDIKNLATRVSGRTARAKGQCVRPLQH